MEVEHVVLHRRSVLHEHIVQHEQVVVQRVEMDNIQQQRELQVVVHVRHEIIVQAER